MSRLVSLCCGIGVILTALGRNVGVPQPVRVCGVCPGVELRSLEPPPKCEYD